MTTRLLLVDANAYDDANSVGAALLSSLEQTPSRVAASYEVSGERSAHVVVLHESDAALASELQLAPGVLAEYQQISGPDSLMATGSILHIAGHSPPRCQEEAFGTWVDQEHLESVSSIPGVISARRFVLTPDSTPVTDQSGLRFPVLLTVSAVSASSVVDHPDFTHEQARARAMAYVPDRAPYELVATPTDVSLGQLPRCFIATYDQ